MNEKIKVRKLKEDEFRRKRKEQEDEKILKSKQNQMKRDDAECKRIKMEDDKKKKNCELNKVSKVVKDKKDQHSTWELKLLKLKDILLKE